MKIDLVKVNFGSHLYGTADELSDYDYKTVYLPDYGSLLLGKAPKNYKSRECGPNDKMLPGEEEIEYIPVHRLAYDFLEGQTYAYEIIFGILNSEEQQYEILDKDKFALFKRFILNLALKYLTKDISKMVAYAAHQAQVYGVKGARLNAAETLLAFLKTIENSDSRLKDIVIPVEVVNAYVKYAYITGTNQEYNNTLALQVNDRYYHLTERVSHVISQLEKLIEKYGHRARKAQDQEVDWKALSHAIRISYQACEILEKNELRFPLKIADYLKDVKRGKVPFEAAIAQFEVLNNTMDMLLDKTTLPAKTNKLREEFEKDFVEWLEKFYYQQDK